MFDLLRRSWFGWYFDKDESGSGGSPDDSTEDNADKKDQSDKPDAGDEKKKEAKDEKVYSKAEVEDLIKDRLEREKKKSDAAAEKARKEADEAALQKNQEWQKLAESREKEIATLTKERDDLTTVKEQADRYQKALDSLLAEQKKNLPKHILQLIDKMDPVEAMAYITENAEALGAKPQTYSETPEGKEKKVSDDDKKEGQRASQNVITRTF